MQNFTTWERVGLLIPHNYVYRENDKLGYVIRFPVRENIFDQISGIYKHETVNADHTSALGVHIFSGSSLV